MKRSAIPACLLLSAGSLLGACGSEASIDYNGEPLTSISGSVVIQNERAPSDLVPALAFATPAGMEVMDVSVSGEFPARFTLDVFTPPPEEAANVAEDGARKIKYALGYITAVTPQHPPFFPVAQDASANSCWTSSAEVDSSPCQQDQSWCTADHSACYTEHSLCDRTTNVCHVVSSSGDASLADPWMHFAGLSRNYWLLYLWDDAGPGTALSLALAQGGTVSQGYHLLHVTPNPAPPQGTTYDHCPDGVTQAALDEYNAMHGTTYKSTSEIPVTNNGEIWKELSRLEAQVLADGRCPPADVTLELVDAASTQPITVELGDDLQPSGGGL